MDLFKSSEKTFPSLLSATPQSKQTEKGCQPFEIGKKGMAGFNSSLPHLYFQTLWDPGFMSKCILISGEKEQLSGFYFLFSCNHQPTPPRPKIWREEGENERLLLNLNEVHNLSWGPPTKPTLLPVPQELTKSTLGGERGSPQKLFWKSNQTKADPQEH